MNGSNSITPAVKGAGRGSLHAPSARIMRQIRWPGPVLPRVKKNSFPSGEKVPAKFLPYSNSVETIPGAKSFGVDPGGVNPK